MAEAAIVAAKKEEAEPVPVIEPWVEPDSLEALLDAYIVESKFCGRAPASTMYCVHAKKRDGTHTQCLPDQRFKLFIIARHVLVAAFFENEKIDLGYGNLDVLSWLIIVIIISYYILLQYVATQSVR